MDKIDYQNLLAEKQQTIDSLRAELEAMTQDRDSQQRVCCEQIKRNAKLVEIVGECDDCLTDMLFPATEDQAKRKAGRIMAKIAEQALKENASV